MTAFHRLLIPFACLLSVNWMLPGTAMAYPERLPKLETTEGVFFKVRVREVTPDAVVFFHRDGIAKVALADMGAEHQAEFGYSPEAAAAYQQEIAREEAERKAAESQRALAELEAAAERMAAPSAFGRQVSREASKPDAALFSGGIPLLKREVDLRPDFRELSLLSKDQGLRPSCAVFAVVSALEFQNARVTGESERLSEEYLIWATREALGLGEVSLTDAMGGEAAAAGADAGFTLMEVVSALRSYGIPPQSQMPNTFGKGMDAIEPPPESLIEQAKNRRAIHAYEVPGRENRVVLQHIIRLLNDGQPVVIGTRWPPMRTLEAGHFLSEQAALDDYAHAVTLVGYRCETGRLEDARFIFKNSWGVNWGLAGYGFATYPFLERHLTSAIFLEVGQGEVALR